MPERGDLMSLSNGNADADTSTTPKTIVVPMDGRRIAYAMKSENQIELLESERKFFKEFLSRERSTSKRFQIARAMLLIDKGAFAEEKYTFDEVVVKTGLCLRSLYNLRKKFLSYGIDGVLGRKIPERPSSLPKLNGEKEARLINIACSTPPDGRTRWTLKLLKEKLIELEIVDSISTSTISRVLNNNDLQPHLSEYYKIPTCNDAEFVFRMEKIINNCYLANINEGIEVIAMDESSVQLLEEVIPPLNGKPGSIKKIDPEYKRKGVAEIFLMTNPHQGKRYLEICKTRCCEDWANFMKKIADDIYPNAKKILVVCDNLNIHSGASFYKAFLPEEAERLANKFEFYYTPVHASWLNVAEIEFSRYKKQCLENRRIPTIEDLERETKLWEERCNKEKCTIIWKFTNEDARKKLIHLYPKTQEICTQDNEITEQKESMPIKKIKTEHCEMVLKKAREEREEQKLNNQTDVEQQVKTVIDTQNQQIVSSGVSVEEVQTTSPTKPSINTSSQANEKLTTTSPLQKVEIVKSTPFAGKKRILSTPEFSHNRIKLPLLPSIREWQESNMDKTDQILSGDLSIE